MLPRPTNIAISISKSRSLQGSKTGAALGTRPSHARTAWPHGRRTGVPLTTTEDARPWYPTGRCRLRGAGHEGARETASALAPPRRSQETEDAPVGEESVGRVAEHGPHVGGMLLGGIKVGVVAHRGGHVHCGGGLGHQRTSTECLVVTQDATVAGKERGEARAHSHIVLAAQTHKRVQRRAAQRRLRPRIVRQQLRDSSDIQDGIANRNTNPLLRLRGRASQRPVSAHPLWSKVERILRSGFDTPPEAHPKQRSYGSGGGVGVGWWSLQLLEQWRW